MGSFEWKQILIDGVNLAANKTPFPCWGELNMDEVDLLMKSINWPINLPAMNLDSRKRTDEKVTGNRILDYGGDFDYVS